MSKKIKEVSLKMKDLIDFIYSYEDKEQMIIVLNEFVIDNFFELKLMHRIMIAFCIIFKRYDLEHTKRGE